MQKQYVTPLVVVLLLVMGLSAGGMALAAEPRASLPDIEDEVMCPTCGTPLNLAFSPQAERERRFIRQQIAEGKTKQQIKDALVGEFGRSVLALPRGRGFDLAAYLVPAVAVAIAAGALGLGLLRWRRRSAWGDGDAGDVDLSPADSARLESDLSRYDL
jgi:cytochrome c-type biogenesis protein CcmH